MTNALSTDEAARLLHSARLAARPLSRAALGSFEVATGYAVQDRLVALVGQRQIGWKAGLTSPAAQAVYGAEEPMAGRLFADRLIESGGALDPALACAPKLEGEVLLEVGVAPPPDAGDETLLDSLLSVRAAIEVADSRYEGWPPSMAHAVADNACGGWLVAGPPVPPRSLDLAAAAMTMTADGATVSEGRGSDCLGHPLNSYRWFLEHAARRGWELTPGALLLTGALGAAVPMRAGTDYAVTLDGLGTVSLRYASDGT